MDNKNSEQNGSYIEYPVWDINVRIFHWLNAILIIILMGLGLVIMNEKSLGISSEGKIVLKSIHTYVGYIFVTNLVWRIIWGFIGANSARWKTIFRFGKGYTGEFLVYLKSLFAGNTVHYLGHNPAARLMIVFLYAMLITQGMTGLILAGTDLYLPPFGHEIKEYVANAGEDHNKLANIKPGSKQGLDETAYKKMRAARETIAETHETFFYLIIIAVILHIWGVVFTEIKEKNAIVSAMITGKKYFKSPPLDLEK